MYLPRARIQPVCKPHTLLYCMLLRRNIQTHLQKAHWLQVPGTNVMFRVQNLTLRSKAIIAGVLLCVIVSSCIAAREGVRMVYLDVLLHLNMVSADTANALGYYYFNGGAYNLGEAQFAFSQAIKISGDHIERAHFELARLDFIQANFPGAIAEVNTEMQLYPKDDQSWYLRGLI